MFTTFYVMEIFMQRRASANSAVTQGISILRNDPAFDDVIAPGTVIEKVASGFQFTEGPLWRQGRLWFSDLVGNRMYAVTPDGKVDLLIEHSGGLQNIAPNSFKGSNAMVADRDGGVLMCQHGVRRIVRLDKNLHQTIFLDRWEGKRFNSPNDIVFAPDGALWFTDPPFGLDKQDEDSAKEIPFNGVYRYADGKLTAAIKDLTNPNGIGFSPDGKFLYVANSGPKMFVNKYEVKSAGTLGRPSTLISYPDQPNNEVPDGLKVDSSGNIWTSGPGGIRIVTPRGKVLGQIKLPEVAANLAWAEDGYTLYITASSSIYRLKVSIAGQMPLFSR
ncbi:SMP-30/gluconolactonase/LRE family protein [Edaphobacter sp. 12200R-103]|nr:SMP-30/gluconolactonase/LRE family protein [Edaphobacter sp. 12200R-103]